MCNEFIVIFFRGERSNANPPGNKNATECLIDGRNYAVGSRVFYKCDDYYIRRGDALRTCQPDGSWKGVIPLCEPGIE